MKYSDFSAFTPYADEAMELPQRQQETMFKRQWFGFDDIYFILIVKSRSNPFL